MWFKELDIVGSFCHGIDPLRGTSAHSFRRAIEIITNGVPMETLVTDIFPLEQLPRAVEKAGARESGSIKVLLDVNPV